MAKPLRITIKGTDNLGVDAPRVEDLLSQISDLVNVLQGVEEAVADGGAPEIEWRVTDARMNSPLSLEVTPFPKKHAMNIDVRAEQVVNATAAGIASIVERAERPIYFSDNLLGRVERIFDRISNGLERTVVDVSGYENAPPIVLDRSFARRASQNLEAFRSPDAISYRELGSVEGFVSKVELDGYNRPIVWLRTRIDGRVVKCVAKRRGLDRIGHYEVSEVLSGLRIQVFGLINYKDLEKISTVEVDDIHVFESESELPDIDEIVAPGFTAGLEANEYLRRLRSDE